MASTAWSPSAIFSPTVARQQQAQAKDWNYVDTWLTAKFGGRTAPAFERNADTLKALLLLAAWNENADEERDLVARLDARALAELKEEIATDPDTEILSAISAHLTRDGRQSLDALSGLAAMLHSTSVHPPHLAQEVLSLTSNAAALTQQHARVSFTQSRMEAEISRLKCLLEQLQSRAFSTPDALLAQTSEWTRETKKLGVKVASYKDRIAARPGIQADWPSLAEVGQQEEEVRQGLERVRELEGRLRRFHRVPVERERAKAEVERVRRELARVTRERDRLFETLVEGEGGEG
ncbi:MAG: hypothetical protein M1829_006591 [Trizodia sp. TS-e1964]|nr:MAG: hypothetical protein M1829_006591 [Trizodia sp. TS-e1964]